MFIRKIVFIQFVNLLTLSKEIEKQTFQDQNICGVRVKLKITGNIFPNSIQVISSRELEHVIGNSYPATF